MTDYKKFDKIAKTLDEDNPYERAKQIMHLQPLFKHDVDWYLKNHPCPDSTYACLYQMMDAGWDQDCIDYKLAQVVHYSDVAKEYMSMKKAVTDYMIQSDINNVQENFEKNKKNSRG